MISSVRDICINTRLALDYKLSCTVMIKFDLLYCIDIVFNNSKKYNTDLFRYHSNVVSEF